MASQEIIGQNIVFLEFAGFQILWSEFFYNLRTDPIYIIISMEEQVLPIGTYIRNIFGVGGIDGTIQSQSFCPVTITGFKADE